MRLGLLLILSLPCICIAADPATKPADANNLAGIHVDVKAKQIRVDCEAIDCQSLGSVIRKGPRRPAKSCSESREMRLGGLQPGSR